jgi:hypothetical protein
MNEKNSRLGLSNRLERYKDLENDKEKMVEKRTKNEKDD